MKSMYGILPQWHGRDGKIRAENDQGKKDSGLCVDHVD